jgi:predicted dehydrogenase
MVAESMRYQKMQMTVRDVIASGRIGQVLSGRINMIGKGRHEYAYPGRRSWLSDPELGSGMWMLNGIHQMSAARMLFGEVAGIDAREVHSEKFKGGLEATVVALITFENGAVVTMTASAELHGYGRFGDTVVFGAGGTVQAPHRGGEVLVYTDSEEPEVIECPDELIDGVTPQFVRQMEEFVSAVEEQREPYTSGVSERASLAGVLAGYESIRRAAPVRPAY